MSSLHFHNYTDMEGQEVTTAAGQCAKCSRGVNSLIIMGTKQLSPQTTKLKMECIACRTKYQIVVKN